MPEERLPSRREVLAELANEAQEWGMYDGVPLSVTHGHEPYCDWCGRAIMHIGGVWHAVKGEERGYDPVPCDANDDDGLHEPARATSEPKDTP